MKTMKKIAIFAVEFILVLSLGIILMVTLTGGFSIPFGLLTFDLYK